MFQHAAAILLATSFTTYPGLGDKGLTTPRAADRSPRIEAATDKGPIVELIVRCPKGTAIISYSKIERFYCSPQHACDRQFAVVLARTCR